MSWELATVNSDPVGQHEPLLLMAENGRIPASDQCAEQIVPDARFRPDDAEGTGINATDLNMRRLVRAWTLDRTPETREVEEPGALIARNPEVTFNRIALTRFNHIFPDTIRESQTLANPQPADEDAGNLGYALGNPERDHRNAFGRLKGSRAEVGT